MPLQQLLDLMLHNTSRESVVSVTIMSLVFVDGSVSSDRKMHSTPDHWSCVSLKTLAIFSSDHTLQNARIVPPWLLDNACELTSVSLSYLTVLTGSCDTSENVRKTKTEVYSQDVTYGYLCYIAQEDLKNLTGWTNVHLIEWLDPWRNIVSYKYKCN